MEDDRRQSAGARDLLILSPADLQPLHLSRLLGRPSEEGDLTLLGLSAQS